MDFKILLDFKNVIGQELFKRKTSETTEFTDCFENVLPLLEKCENWFQTLKTHCKKSYPLIRIRNKTVKSSAADNFIIQRNKLKQHIEDGISSDVNELDKLEGKIAYIIAEE